MVMRVIASLVIIIRSSIIVSISNTTVSCIMSISMIIIIRRSSRQTWLCRKMWTFVSGSL